MNKLSKGLIVSGLGAVLLLGTGGSLALWNVSASSEAGQIVTGDLNLSVPTEDQVWETVDAEGTWTPISDISDYTIVPGEIVRLTQPLDVTLVGDKMAAELTVDTSQAIKAAAGGSLPGEFLKVESAFADAPAGESLPTQVGTSNTWAFDSELANGTARFTQQITFSFSSEVTDRIGALATIDLAETNFVLEQKFDNPAA